MTTLLERLQEAKEEHEVAHVSFFNDGVVRTDENYSAKRIKDANNPDGFKAIEDVFYDATRSYSRNYDFDSIEMSLLLGLIFNKSDINSENAIKEDAEPIKGVVRYYTGSIKSYLGDEQTNKVDYEAYGIGRQGYINYDQLMKAIKKSGLSYNGPETFEEFEESVLIGEPFDITLSAGLKKKDNTSVAVARR